MKKLLCLALLVSAGSIYSESISANNKPTDNKSGNNSKDIYKKTWIDFNKNGIKDVYEDPSAPIEARIADLLSQMTLEEKTCQMATLYGSGRVLKDAWPTAGWSAEIWKDGIGNIDEQANGLGKFGSEISYPYANSVKNRHTIQRWFVEQTRLGIPVDFTNEGIRGLCHDRATMFPAQCGQGATWNKKLIREIAKVTANEAKALGYTNIYSPILDIAQDPRWGRVVESYGEDPYLAGELGKQMILGLQSEGIVATPKHFAVYSIPVGGRDGGTRTDPHVAPREMKTLYLEPFRKGIQEAGALGVMSSYNDYDGEPVSGSYHFLTEILRQQWGFKGYVYSDWGAVAMLKDFQHTAKDDSEAAIQALTAGVDLEASSNCYWALEQLIEQGRFDEKYVDLAVGRILRVKFELGLFENPYQGADMPGVAMRTKEAVELSRRVADESIVLLKNENTLLPLNLNKIKSLAVIGPNANQVQFGDYTWSRSNKDGVTPLEGLKKRVGNKIKINYAAGCDLITDNKSGFDEAVAAVKASDMAVVFVGSSSASLARDYSDATCGEGFDLSSLDLTGVQEELVEEIYAIGKPVIVVLVTGKPFSISWIKEHIPAIVVQWYGGEKAGDAIADMLLGNINPSAKLPFSFPQSVGHLPVFYNHLPTDKGFYRRPGRPNEPGRDYVFSSPAPLWSFGHGLSYTTFEYLNAHYSAELLHPSDTLIVSVSLKNTGSVAGKEVVQLYVRDVVSSVVTPVKQLKAFSKPFLQPGEMQTVVLKLPIQELALYDLSMKKVVEEGEYEIQIGTASDDIRLRRTIFVGRQPVTSNSLGHNDFCMDEIVKNPGRKIKVAGCVRDVQATPISGIEIKSNYSGRTVISKEGGRYSILTVENDVLTVSAKGFETVNIKVNKQKDIDIKLNYSHD